MKHAFLWLIFLCPFYLCSQAQNKIPTPNQQQAQPRKQTQKFTISGYITDKDNGENLIGANVFNRLSSSGTSSNNFGFFSLSLPSDSVKLVCTYVGYKPTEISFYLQKDTILHFSLEGARYLQEVVVSAHEEEAIQESSQMSAINIPIAQIKSMPALLGEVDIFKVLQLLPGVQSGNEGSSGLYVRGGGPDQNLILLDGVPVYNASHLFGFFSVFNADAIHKVELVKGGFPARYGGRLSSVIDINMKEGNRQKFAGEGSLGLISSRLTLEGPIVRDRSSFIISGRRTYIDMLTTPLMKAFSDEFVAGYYFYDLNAKINYKIGEKDRIYLSAYMGNDKGYGRTEYNTGLDKTENEFGLQWGNLTAALRWNHIISSKLFSNLSLNYSRYHFNLFTQHKYIPHEKEKQAEESVFQYGQFMSAIQDWGAKVDFDYLPNPNHYIRMGTSAVSHRFSPGAFALNTNQMADTSYGAIPMYGNEFTGYIEDDIRLGRRIKLNAGLHFSAFQVEDVFYPSLQPRLSTRYLIKPTLALKASYARMTQFIHLLSNSGIGLPTDLWVPATGQIRPQESQQVALGIASSKYEGFELSVEAYYKAMENVIEYMEGANYFSFDSNWQDKVVIGSGESYGAEFFVQKKQGKFSGWIGYTLSWTNRQFEELNNGNPFPFKYDRRHDISMAAMHKLNDKIDISLSWVYGSGSAVTMPIGSYLYADQHFNTADQFWGRDVELYGERNGYRMRAFHRLDVSVSMSKQNKWGIRKWNFGLYNAYSRRNPFFIDVRHLEGKRKFLEVSLFPVIPGVSYGFKF